MADRRHVYVVLDGMRGVAAVAVLSYHFNPQFGLAPWFYGAQIAVDLFFVLSGFVLTHAYEGKFLSGLSARQFFLERLIRLYPLYLLAILLPVAGLLLGAVLSGQLGSALRQSAEQFPWNLLFLPAPGTSNAPLFPLNTPAWSLFFELVANLFFGLFRWRVSNLALSCIVAAALACLTLIALRGGDLSGGVDWATLGAGAARVAFSFSAGVLLYRLTHNWRPKAFNPWLPMIGLTAMLWAPAMQGPTAPLYKLLAIAVVSPALVLLGAQLRPTGVSANLFAFAGAVSYGVYVLHEPLLGVADPIARRLTGHSLYQTGPVACLAAAAVVIAAAWAAHRVYDVPLRRWLTAQIRARKPRVAVG